MSDDDPNRETLEARARALARPRISAQQRRDAPVFAVFEHKSRRYAIDSRHVREVTRVLAPTALPRVAPHWLGLTTLHGELLALIDLPRLLGDDSEQAASAGDDDRALRHTLVIVLGSDRVELGIVVDALLEARAITDDVLQVEARDGAAQAGLVSGATSDGVRVVAADALLADPRLFMPSNQPSES